MSKFLEGIQTIPLGQRKNRFSSNPKKIILCYSKVNCLIGYLCIYRSTNTFLLRPRA